MEQISLSNEVWKKEDYLIFLISILGSTEGSKVMFYSQYE